MAKVSHAELLRRHVEDLYEHATLCWKEGGEVKLEEAEKARQNSTSIHIRMHFACSSCPPPARLLTPTCHVRNSTCCLRVCDYLLPTLM